MKLGDIVTDVVVHPRKLTHYALDAASPAGQHKAVLFQQILGFTKDNFRALQAQLEARALQAEATFHSEDSYGIRYTVDIPVEGPEGQQAIVRTGWLVPPKLPEAQLITLYVKQR